MAPFTTISRDLLGNFVIPVPTVLGSCRVIGFGPERGSILAGVLLNHNLNCHWPLWTPVSRDQ